MTRQTTSISSNVWLWLGASIAITEMIAGALFAPLGWSKGFSAILLGHVIGGIMLFLAGRIGAETTRTAMNTIKIAFGEKGGLFFSVCNVLQLVGWTAVMIATGAGAMNVLIGRDNASIVLGSLLIGALIFVWMLFGPQSFGIFNSIIVMCLAVLCIFITYKVSSAGVSTPAELEDLSFGAAVELAVAMPLSWLPVISDYTSRAKRPVLTNTLSNLAYFVGSTWMYTIGMGAAILTGYTDVSLLMKAMGLGVVGLIVIILSTVTTTFLDARSAAISFTTITNVIPERTLAVIVTILGTIMACTLSMANYESFLYLIGSLFTPMVGVLLTEYYVLGKKDVTESINLINFGVWLVGFILYRALLGYAPITGITLPVVLIIGVLTYVAHKITHR